VTWVEFSDEAAFNAWHDQKCADLGLPRPGERQSDGAVVLDAQWTTAYVQPVLDGGTIKAFLPEADAVGLTASTEPAREQFGAPTTVAKVPFSVEKPLPDTWIVNGTPVAVPRQAIEVPVGVPGRRVAAVAASATVAGGLIVEGLRALGVL
jgi:hypothetical protein